MNWNELYQMQYELDLFIEKEHGLTETDLLQYKLLALSVEAGELANETRCFKFWSLKGASEKSVILEEYVDGIHFLLSIGLDTELRYERNESLKTEDYSLTELFLRFNRSISEFEQAHTQAHYNQMWETYLLIGEKLDFTAGDTIRAYKEKNEVNIKRQKNKY